MGSAALSLTTLFSSFITSPETVSPELSVAGDRLKIIGRHTARFQHIIDDLGVKLNGQALQDVGFETTIRGDQEEVTIVLPYEPKAGDVITVDTAVHTFGSKKITLRVE